MYYNSDQKRMMITTSETYCLNARKCNPAGPYRALLEQTPPLYPLLKYPDNII